MSEDETELPLVVAEDFPGYDRSQAYHMSKAIDLYFRSSFDWNVVLAEGLISKATLYRYLQNPDFVSKIQELLEPYKKVVLDKAINTYVKALDCADNWADRIKAADRLAAAYSPDLFDPSTRREIARTKGDLLNKIAVASLTPKRIKEMIAKDPFGAIDVTPKDEGHD